MSCFTLPDLQWPGEVQLKQTHKETVAHVPLTPYTLFMNGSGAFPCPLEVLECARYRFKTGAQMALKAQCST